MADICNAGIPKGVAIPAIWFPDFNHAQDQFTFNNYVDKPLRCDMQEIKPGKKCEPTTVSPAASSQGASSPSGFARI